MTNLAKKFYKQDEKSCKNGEESVLSIPTFPLAALHRKQTYNGKGRKAESPPSLLPFVIQYLRPDLQQRHAVGTQPDDDTVLMDPQILAAPQVADTHLTAAAQLVPADKDICIGL